jgi:[protein-PII] uridylyltransferase
LIHELYEAAEERLRLGHVQHGRAERVAAKTARGGRAAGAGQQAGRALRPSSFNDAYWIAEPDDIIAMNLTQLDRARAKALDRPYRILCRRAGQRW